MFKWNGNMVNQLVKQPAGDGLNDAAEFILDEANKLVPHDEGNLQQSGIVSFDEAQMTSCISYETPYAIRLHEHPEYKFQGGRQGKWLETAYNDNAKEANNHIANKVKAALRG